MASPVGPAASAEKASAATEAVSSAAAAGVAADISPADVRAEIAGHEQSGGAPSEGAGAEPDAGGRTGPRGTSSVEAPPAESHEGDDYSEEDAAAATAAQDRAASSLPKEHAEVWNKYKDEGARAQALYDAQRRLAELERGTGTDKAGATAAAEADAPLTVPAAPTIAEIETLVTSLIDTDPDVGAYVRKVRGYATEAQAAYKARGEIDTKLGESSRAIERKLGVVEDLVEQAKANPEDFRLRERLQDQQRQLSDLRFAHQDLIQKRAEAIEQLATSSAAYRDGRERVYAHAHGLLTQQRQQAHSQEVEKREIKRWSQEWQASFPRAMERLGVPEAKRAQAEQILLRAMYAETGAVPDLFQWMLGEGKKVADFIGDVRAAATDQYLATKKADANQTRAAAAPRGDRAVVKEQQQGKRPERVSSREASRLAGEGFSRSLKAIR